MLIKNYVKNSFISLFLIPVFIYNLIRKKNNFDVKDYFDLNTGLNIYGPKLDRGLGKIAESFIDSAKIYFPIRFIILQQNSDIFKGYNSDKGGSVDLIIGNPDYLFKYLLRKPLGVFKNFKIGYFFWELESYPLFWKYKLLFFDEVWVSSEFNYKLFKKIHPNVKKIPFQVSLPCKKKKFDKKYFKIPQSKFIFLFFFDFASGFYRKNPDGLVKAFITAFKNNKNVLLYIKSSRGHEDKDNYLYLKNMIKNYPNIIFLNKYLTNLQTNSLLNISDCYVSLHRSEGLGLPMAEAMLLGKPVIATNYSGNLEFMNSSNSFLVNYTMTNVNDNYTNSDKNSLWADPDLFHAAKLMRKVYSEKANSPKRRIKEYNDFKIINKYSKKNVNQFIKENFL